MTFNTLKVVREGTKKKYRVSGYFTADFFCRRTVRKMIPDGYQMVDGAELSTVHKLNRSDLLRQKGEKQIFGVISASMSSIGLNQYVLEVIDG